MKARFPQIALCLLAALSLGAEPPPAVQVELAQTEETLRQLADLKEKVTQIQVQIDALILALSERRGALANAKPAPFGGLAPVSAIVDRPDPKPRVARCAALTKEGERCSRAAQAGSRYCKQHALAKMK